MGAKTNISWFFNSLTTLVIVVFIVLNSFNTIVLAAPLSITSNAQPSVTVYGDIGLPNYAAITPPDGTDMITNSPIASTEGIEASYSVPSIGVCNLATITSFNVSLSSLTGSFTLPVTQNFSGISVSVFDKTSESRQSVSTVNSGTRFDGAFALILDPTISNAVVRGITNPGFTTVATPLPGAVDFDMDVSSMTVGDYNNLAITVQHDMYDPPNGYANQLTSSQPVVSVNYDDGPCDDDGDGYTNAVEDSSSYDRSDYCIPSFTAVGSSDCDNDGLTATQEASAGTDPSNPDSDGDGYLDGAEVLGASSSDPLDKCDPDSSQCLADTGDPNNYQKVIIGAVLIAISILLHKRRIAVYKLKS
jgi:hypothetical protein